MAGSAEAAERTGWPESSPVVAMPLRSSCYLLGSLNRILEPGGGADEAERRRLARDLHDEIGQNLTVLGLNLSLVKAQLGLGASPQLTARLDDSLQLVKETTERVRRVKADMRSHVLDEHGLLPILRWRGEELTGRTGVQVTVQRVEPPARLSAPVQDALVRILQEALTNVVKHARATWVTIRLTEMEQGLRLTIEDDGVGFDGGSVDPPESSHGGFLTMTERAAGGAHCSIDAQAGGGTRIIRDLKR